MPVHPHLWSHSEDAQAWSHSGDFSGIQSKKTPEWFLVGCWTIPQDENLTDL